MTSCLGKSCSFGLLCLCFMGVCQILYVSFFPFGAEGRMWDVIVLIPDHCLSISFKTPSVEFRLKVTKDI